MLPQSPTTFALAEGVVGVFTSRGVGNLAHRRQHTPGELHSSRRALAAALGVEVADLHHMRQVHGNTVATIDGRSPRGLEARDADALVTDQPGRALVVQAADCVPILVAGDAGPIGVAHAGRAGVADGVVGALVESLVAMGSAAEDLHAAIGPAIGGCCYEVPEDLAHDVAKRVSDKHEPQVTGALVARTNWGTTSLDLPETVAQMLESSGIGDVRRTPGCTRCDDQQRWFSHRRDPSTGRHVGAVVIEVAA